MPTRKLYESEKVRRHAEYLRRKAVKLAKLPPDPITTLSDIERGYVAGLIDGEGSIYLTPVGPHRKRTVYPTVVIAMTDRSTICWLVARLKSGKMQLHNQTNLRRYPHIKPQYRFQLFGKRAKLLCEVVESVLITKRAQASLVCKFPGGDRMVSPLSDLGRQINEARYRIRDQVNALNHQSPQPVFMCMEDNNGLQV